MQRIQSNEHVSFSFTFLDVRHHCAFFQCISPHYSHFKIKYFATKTFLCKVSLCSIYLHAIAQHQYAVLFKIFHHIPRTRIFNMLQQSTCATISLAFLEAWKCLFFFFKILVLGFVYPWYIFHIFCLFSGNVLISVFCAIISFLWPSLIPIISFFKISFQSKMDPCLNWRKDHKKAVSKIPNKQIYLCKTRNRVWCRWKLQWEEEWWK